jgi:osmotically-inducible protein OsmY
MTDPQLQQHVVSALDWDPSVDAADIGVTVENGVVTLRGDVTSFLEKEAADRIALHVYGVKAVANDLRVQLPSGHERTDSDIAQAAVHALAWNMSVPKDRVTISVRDGQVIVKGSVDWQYQKEAVSRAIRVLAGVRGVTNHIAVKPTIRVVDVATRIESAFKRSAEIDARRVAVSVQDGKVTLTGNVRSWAERQEAERAVWAAPGVAEVDDRLAVVP